MKKHTFGVPIEQDILEIQGKEYRLEPFGMRSFRYAMEQSAEAAKISEMEGIDRTNSTYNLSVDLIIRSVHSDDQDRVRQHIEDSVPPVLVSQIAAAIMRGLTDVDPTQPTSSSDGSSTTGDDSTDGVSDEESTPPS